MVAVLISCSFCCENEELNERLFSVGLYILDGLLSFSVEYRIVEKKVASSNPSWINTQSFKLTEYIELPFRS